MLEALLLAIALAMDAAAVAAARSAAGLRARSAIALAASFCVFQVGMAAAGWALGATAKELIERWDHWIAFGLLTAIGVKTLYSAIRGGDDDDARPDLGLHALVGLSIATSIDALAAGVTLPMLPVSPPIALALIGVAALLLSLAGAAAGRALGTRLGKPLEIVGGLTLIALGAKAAIQG